MVIFLIDLVSKMVHVSKIDNFASKMGNFVTKIAHFVANMVDFVAEIAKFVMKVVNFPQKWFILFRNWRFCTTIFIFFREISIKLIDNNISVDKNCLVFKNF